MEYMSPPTIISLFINWTSRMFFSLVNLIRKFICSNHLVYILDSNCQQQRMFCLSMQRQQWLELLIQEKLAWLQLNDLFSLLATLADSMSEELHSDKMVRGNSKQGHYAIKGNHYLMCSQNGLLDKTPWKHVGKITLPLKLTCFIKLALTGVFITQDYQSKKVNPSHQMLYVSSSFKKCQSCSYAFSSCNRYLGLFPFFFFF